MVNKTYLKTNKIPYLQYLFRCKIPKDLVKVFSQKQFSISLKSNSYRHSKIISFNLYKTTQFIFDEVRQGFMQDITLDDVKVILRDKVRQTIKHINLYEWETNKWSEKELQKRIDEIDEKENKLRERLQNDFKGTAAHLAKEVDKILKEKDLKPDKNQYEYRGLISRWTDLQVIREGWKRDLPKRGEVYHKNVGRFFNDKYLRKIGLKEGRRKIPFHSFRHSVETHLTNQNVNPRFIDFLQGHSQKGMGGNVYMKGITIDVLLNECVEKINWDVEWEKLKVKW